MPFICQYGDTSVHPCGWFCKKVCYEPAWYAKSRLLSSGELTNDSWLQSFYILLGELWLCVFLFKGMLLCLTLDIGRYGRGLVCALCSASRVCSGGLRSGRGAVSQIALVSEAKAFTVACLQVHVLVLENKEWKSIVGFRVLKCHYWKLRFCSHCTGILQE